MNSTEFLLIFLYRNAFINFRMGKASAVAWVILIIIMLFAPQGILNINPWQKVKSLLSFLVSKSGEETTE